MLGGLDEVVGDGRLEQLDRVDDVVVLLPHGCECDAGAEDGCAVRCRGSLRQELLQRLLAAVGVAQADGKLEVG